MQAKVDENIIEFLNREDVQEALANNDMQTFYRLSESVMGTTIGKLTKLLIEAGVDPLQGMTEIPTRFLQDQKGIKEFNIPEGITKIGKYSFEFTGLESVCISNSVEEVGRRAFYKTEFLKEVRLPRGIVLGHSCFAHSGLESIELKDAQFKIDTFWQFEDCKNLKSAIIKGNTTYLPRNLFDGCSNLTYVELPAALGAIESGIFRGCDKLREINFEGTAEQWKQIKISRHNVGLFSCKIICSGSTLRFDNSTEEWIEI